MRILFLIDRINLNLLQGDSVMAKQILEGLASAGNEITAISHGVSSNARVFSPAPFSYYSRAYSCPLAFRFTLKKLKELVEKEKFDCAVINPLIIAGRKSFWVRLPSPLKAKDAPFYSSLRKILKSKNIPLVYWLHGITEKNSFLSFYCGSNKEVLLSQLKRCSGIAVLSREQQGLLEKEGIKNNFFVLPALVDTRKFLPLKPSSKIKEKYCLEGFNILYLSSSADLPDLAFFWDILAKTNKEISMVINSEAKPHLLDYLEKKGIRERVKFVGKIPQNELVEFINSCSAGVYLKKFCFPIGNASTMTKISEYMACSLPVITVSISGPMEQAGKKAILLGENAAGAAQKINQLFFEEKNRKEIGREMRRKAVKELDLKSGIAKFEKFLEEITCA